MRLHENLQLFKDAVISASQPISAGGLGIPQVFIEKDYWICRSLKLMAENDPNQSTVFKGGTSLSKAYGIGARFSEDIDIAISDALSMSGNKLKKLINKTAHNMTQGLKEIPIPGKTSKGSHYYKAFYQYPEIADILTTSPINSGQLLIEINSFANPYPSERRVIQSFLTTFLQTSNNQSMIDEYEMEPFQVVVLDKRRTLVEKIVSIIRSSLAYEYHSQLSEKIRHFYDIHYLSQDEDIRAYVNSSDFSNELKELFQHDQATFDKPEGWQERDMNDSPLFISFSDVWGNLTTKYTSELSGLAYDEIPTPSQISESVQRILSAIRQ